MRWFEHQHSWFPNIITVIAVGPQYMMPVDGKALLYPQQCHCGAVRTVEIEHGKAPTIRMGENRKCPIQRAKKTKLK